MAARRAVPAAKRVAAIGSSLVVSEGSRRTCSQRADAITLCASSPHEQRDVDLADDALRQRRAAVARVGSDADGGASVEGRIPEPMGVAQQRLHSEHVLPAGRLCHPPSDPAEGVAHILDRGAAQAADGELGEEPPGRDLEVAATVLGQQ